MQTGTMEHPRTVTDCRIENRDARRRTLRRVWAALIAWSMLWGLIHVPGGMYSWHYFATGGSLLRAVGSSTGGVHVFASHPQLQMGPVALLGAAVVTLVGGAAATALAALLMSGLGLVVLFVVFDAGAKLHGRLPHPRSVLLGGLLVVPVWSEVAVHYGHLDDVLALTLTALAIRAVVTRRPLAAALLLAAATDAKPWAAAFVALLLVPRAGRLRRVLAYLGAAAAGWLPFVLLDPRTLRLGSFTILNAPDSALRALGVDAAVTPAWDRAAQLGIALLLTLWCVRRGRWFAVPLVALATRMLLDPGTYPYYTSGLVVAALMVDVLGGRRRIPWWTVAVVAWYVVGTGLDAAHLMPESGMLRAGFMLGLLGLACAGRGMHHGTPPWKSVRRGSGMRTGLRTLSAR